MTTWHLVGLWWNYQLQVLNVSPHNYHNPPTLLAVFNLLSIAFVLWCCHDIFPMSCEIWIITIYLFKKFIFCRLLSMEFLKNCHLCFWLRIGLHKCKAWIESMMAMLGARLSQLIIVLGLALGKLVAWITCSVCMMTV